jgi:hypothetical protein
LMYLLVQVLLICESCASEFWMMLVSSACASVLSNRSLLLIYQFKASLFLLSHVFLGFFPSVPSCLLLYRWE